MAEGTRFFASERLRRAKILQWLFFEQSYVEPTIGSLRYWRLTGKYEKRKAEAPARERMARGALQALNRELTGRSYLADDYSIADIAVFAYAHRAEDAGFDLSPYPQLSGAGFSTSKKSKGRCRRSFPTASIRIQLARFVIFCRHCRRPLSHDLIQPRSMSQTHDYGAGEVCMTGVEGRRALVTGAGSGEGIGFATALILARQGARVAITSTTKRIFDRLAGMSAPHCGTNAACTLPSSPISRIRRRPTSWSPRPPSALGGIDILVNNAGMVQTGVSQKSSHLHRISDAEWARAIELNLNIAFRTTRAVLPAMMRRRHGRIVHISSITGPLVSNPRSAGYSAGKAAMTGMMRALGARGRGQGDHRQFGGPRLDCHRLPDIRREMVAGRHTPIGRSATGAEIGHVAAFLASDEASYVTGQLIVVDGGNSIQENKGPPKGYY